MVRADLEKCFNDDSLGKTTFVAKGNKIENMNSHLDSMDLDILYHLGQDTSDIEAIKAKYSDVKIVAMGGSRGRVCTFAKYAFEQLNEFYPDIKEEDATTDLAKKAGRFVMFKVGPILTLNHGMGFGCLSIALHETVKLLHYAGAQDVSFIRMGTSGGLGVDPGNIILTKNGYDATLQEGHEVTTVGRKTRYPAPSDNELNNELRRACSELEIPIRIGNTMGTDDFYEAQSRLDGAFCSITADDKFSFLNQAYNKHGILNIEMEANLFLSFCKRANIKGAVMCISIVNRLKGDQIETPKELLKLFELRPLKIIIQMAKNRIFDSSIATPCSSTSSSS